MKKNETTHTNRLYLTKRGLIGTRNVFREKMYDHLLYDKHLRLDDYISFYVNILKYFSLMWEFQNTICHLTNIMA